MKVSLKGLSKKELEKLATDVTKAIEAQEQNLREDAMKAAEAAAAKFGFKLNDLVGPAKGTKKKSKPKYKNPADATQTWSGRGRQPEWYKVAVSSGTSPEDMLV